MAIQERTEGQRRVGTSFNPSANIAVDLIKEKAAELIDLILEEGEGREAAVAATQIETGAMWGVKSVIRKGQKEST